MNHNVKIKGAQAHDTSNSPMHTTNRTDANGAANQLAPHKGRTAHFMACFVACTTIFFALATPDACKAALLVGYETCVNQLLFALFPFLIAANLLVLCGIAPLLGRPLRSLCSLLGFDEDCAAGLFAIALLGGFAPAVSALTQSVQAGQINKGKAGRLLPLVCFLGPSYIVLAVGVGMLGNLRTGVFLYLSQVFASIFAVLLLHLLDVGSRKYIQQSPPVWAETAKDKPKFSASSVPLASPPQTGAPDRKPITKSSNRQPTKNKSIHPIPWPSAQPKTPDFTLSAVIGDSFFSFLRLCGVILYFQFLCAGVCALLPSPYHWLCQMALEVTAACSAIAATGHVATFRCCAALSVLSGSILLQIAALCPAGVSCKRLLLSRLLHLPLALGFFRLFLIIPQTQAVYNSLNERVIAMQRLPLDQALLLFLALVFLADRLRKPLQRR